MFKVYYEFDAEHQQDIGTYSELPTGEQLLALVITMDEDETLHGSDLVAINLSTGKEYFADGEDDNLVWVEV